MSPCPSRILSDHLAGSSCRSAPFKWNLRSLQSQLSSKILSGGWYSSPAPYIVERVWRLQGVEGLTKGLMPKILAAVLLTFFWPGEMFKLYISSSPCTTRTLPSSLISVLLYTILVVSIYRAIVTPRKLDPLNTREVLHVLFSVHERKKPWAIYQIPGLSPAILAILAFNIVFHELVLPYSRFSELEYAVTEGIRVVVRLLATIVLAPLEVIVTRLVLQRNYGGLAFIGGLDVESPPAAAAQSTPLVTVSPILVPVEWQT
ncbi:hypothetical protein DFH09DRAFT_365236 [Mycena vulgaris]|nr:hypothetical protein DFH09DRAFT_365236 [Mycena vulgaris]